MSRKTIAEYLQLWRTTWNTAEEGLRSKKLETNRKFDVSDSSYVSFKFCPNQVPVELHYTKMGFVLRNGEISQKKKVSS